MKSEMETRLTIRKETIYDKIRKKLLILLYRRDQQMIHQFNKLMKPHRPQSKNIIIPKEMRKDRNLS